MLEVAVVLDQNFQPLRWHEPPNRSSVYIPDSRDLWEFIWDNRDLIYGIAHLHPWVGDSVPSHEDVTTFFAIEKALGKKLRWPIVTLSKVDVFVTGDGMTVNRSENNFVPAVVVRGLIERGQNDA